MNSLWLYLEVDPSLTGLVKFVVGQVIKESSLRRWSSLEHPWRLSKAFMRRLSKGMLRLIFYMLLTKQTAYFVVVIIYSCYTFMISTLCCSCFLNAFVRHDVFFIQYWSHVINFLFFVVTSFLYMVYFNYIFDNCFNAESFHATIIYLLLFHNLFIVPGFCKFFTQY